MIAFPEFGSLGGIGDLKVIIGAMLTMILAAAVLTIIVSAIVWAIASSTGNHGMSAKRRVGVLVAIGGAVLAGAGVAWVN